MKYSGIKFAALFLCFVTQIYAQSGWFKSNSEKDGALKDLMDIKFIDEKTGFAVGGWGLVLQTTNAGSYWFSMTIGDMNTHQNISYADKNTIFIGSMDYVNMGSVIFRSKNGGLKWDSVFSVFKCPSGKVFFPSKSIGYFLVTGYYGSRLFKTINGGDLWDSAYTFTNYPLLLSIYFTNNETGYLLGDSYIFKTTDGAASWMEILPAEYKSLLCESIHFVNENTGFITTNNNIFQKCVILKTTNAGNNWKMIEINQTSWIRAIRFENENTGFGVGNTKGKGIIAKTKDGGESWVVTSTDLCKYIYSVDFVNDKTGFAACDEGIILKTTTGGE